MSKWLLTGDGTLNDLGIVIAYCLALLVFWGFASWTEMAKETIDAVFYSSLITLWMIRISRR